MSETAMLNVDRNSINNTDGTTMVAGNLPSGLKNAQFAVLCVFQLITLVLFATVTRFQHKDGPDSVEDNPAQRYYPMFQDVNIMIFIGFGFLMTYLRRNSWTAVCFNYLVAAWSIQIAILFNGLFQCLFTGLWVPIQLDVVQLIQGDFAAAAVLISFGAMLGKINATQLFVMATIEICFYSLNQSIGTIQFKAVDIGGSCFIHTFGGIFGLSVSYVLSDKNAITDHPKNEGSNTTWTFAMIGTIFLWCFWPSFNGCLAPDFQQTRVLVTTCLSLTASCTTCFLVSAICCDGKFNMNDVVNSSLAGGVIIGTFSNMEGAHIWAIVIGSIGGIVSTVGFEKWYGPLFDKLGLHDTCGVAHLHTIPGILGTLAGVIAAACAGDEAYGEDITAIFPARSFRSAGDQALNQFYGLLVTLAIACVSGVITGFILKGLHNADKAAYVFEDERYWVGVDEEKKDK